MQSGVPSNPASAGHGGQEAKSIKQNADEKQGIKRSAKSFGHKHECRQAEYQGREASGHESQQTLQEGRSRGGR
eukprot:scaffold247_cov274-Pinguiococcus_pyrenoidosus.AAC.5